MITQSEEDFTTLNVYWHTQSDPNFATLPVNIAHIWPVKNNLYLFGRQNKFSLRLGTYSGFNPCKTQMQFTDEMRGKYLCFRQGRDKCKKRFKQWSASPHQSTTQLCRVRAVVEKVKALSWQHRFAGTRSTKRTLHNKAWACFKWDPLKISYFTLSV